MSTEWTTYILRQDQFSAQCEPGGKQSQRCQVPEILIIKFRHCDCRGVAQSEGELPALQYEIYGVAFSAGHARAERTSVDDVDLLSRQISDRDHFPSFVFMCLLLFVNLSFCE